MAGERVRWPVVVDRARAIVQGYEGGVTLRQVMYRLVSEGALPHTAPMYRRLSSQLARARREGRFPDLIDTLREVHVPPAWPGVDAFVREMPDWFGLDRTSGQSHAVYIAAEKDTLRQLLTGWLAPYGIPVLVIRGFGSQSYVDVVRDRVTNESRDAVLLTVGDFDCSGKDLEWDVWVSGPEGAGYSEAFFRVSRSWCTRSMCSRTRALSPRPLTTIRRCPWSSPSWSGSPPARPGPLGEAWRRLGREEWQTLGPGSGQPGRRAAVAGGGGAVPQASDGTRSCGAGGETRPVCTRCGTKFTDERWQSTRQSS